MGFSFFFDDSKSNFLQCFLNFLPSLLPPPWSSSPSPPPVSFISLVKYKIRRRWSSCICKFLTQPHPLTTGEVSHHSPASTTSTVPTISAVHLSTQSLLSSSRKWSAIPKPLKSYNNVSSSFRKQPRGQFLIYSWKWQSLIYPNQNHHRTDLWSRDPDHSLPAIPRKHQLVQQWFIAQVWTLCWIRQWHFQPLRWSHIV